MTNQISRISTSNESTGFSTSNESTRFSVANEGAGISTSNRSAGSELTPIKVMKPGCSTLSTTTTRLGSILYRQQSTTSTVINAIYFIPRVTKMASSISYDHTALDILEEGELSDISHDSHEEKKNKFDLVTNRTYERARELVEIIKRKKSCCMCHREMGSKKEEAIRIHVWTHLVIFACKCGYFASRYDTVKHHHDSNHGKATKASIYKVDHANWDIARDILMLPARMPSLPIDKKAVFNTKRDKENRSPRKSPKKVKLLDDVLPRERKVKTLLDEMLPRDEKAKMISPIKTPVKPTDLKITKIASTRTVSTQTSPIKSDDNQQEMQMRKFIQSQNIISNELRKMAAVVEAQTDAFRQYVAKYDANTHG